MSFFKNTYFYAIAVFAGFALVAVFNKSIGTPLSQSALISGSFVLITLRILENKGIRGGWKNRVILILSVIVAAIIGAVVAEMLNIK